MINIIGCGRSRIRGRGKGYKLKPMGQPFWVTGRMSGILPLNRLEVWYP